MPILIAGPPLFKHKAQKVPDMVIKRFVLFVGIMSLIWVIVQIGYGLLVR